MLPLHNCFVTAQLKRENTTLETVTFGGNSTVPNRTLPIITEYKTIHSTSIGGRVYSNLRWWYIPRPLAEGRKADMLTTSEVNKLFDLLKELHGKNKSRDKRTIAIWLKVLEPWTYQQVRAATIERARGGNRYYPDPAEIAQFLPDPGVPVPQPVGSQDAKAKEAQDRLFARMKVERARLIPLRRAAGIPATAE